MRRLIVIKLLSKLSKSAAKRTLMDVKKMSGVRNQVRTSGFGPLKINNEIGIIAVPNKSAITKYSFHSALRT